MGARTASSTLWPCHLRLSFSPQLAPSLGDTSFNPDFMGGWLTSLAFHGWEREKPMGKQISIPSAAYQAQDGAFVFASVALVG